MNITPLTYLKYFYELCGSLYSSKYKSFFVLNMQKIIWVTIIFITQVINVSNHYVKNNHG